ncbi:hypothetical protein J6590_037601 [Homalodisca vitripennis]|nr:hypothetical protein J6590_037601 [Homalodisca vitripennis]
MGIIKSEACVEIPIFSGGISRSTIVGMRGKQAFTLLLIENPPALLNTTSLFTSYTILCATEKNIMTQRLVDVHVCLKGYSNTETVEYLIVSVLLYPFIWTWTPDFGSNLNIELTLLVNVEFSSTFPFSVASDDSHRLDLWTSTSAWRDTTIPKP